MRLRIKIVLLALSAGVVAMGTGACLVRWAGDLVGDVIVQQVVA